MANRINERPSTTAVAFESKFIDWISFAMKFSLWNDVAERTDSRGILWRMTNNAKYHV